MQQAKRLSSDRRLGDELMREALEHRVNQSSEYEKAKNRHLKLLERGFDLGSGGNLAVSRDDFMTDAKVFLDANVLVYAHDISAGTKHPFSSRPSAHVCFNVPRPDRH